MSIPTTGPTDPAHPDAFGISDAGRRLAAAHADARRAGGEGRWIAARLSDGASDGNIYDRREDAIRHQLHETQCCYVVVAPGLMTEREATAYILLNREIYRAGYRIQDSDTLAPMMGVGDFASRARIGKGMAAIAEQQRAASR